MGLRFLVASLLALALVTLQPQRGPDITQRPRVIVSTDIGGTDPDDFQSMVHFLVYSDMSCSSIRT